MSSQELIPVKLPAFSRGAKKTLLVIGMYGVGLCWFGAVALLVAAPALIHAIPHLVFFPVLFTTGLYAAWRLWLKEPVSLPAEGRHRKAPRGQQHRKIAGRRQHRQPGPRTRLARYPASRPRFFNGLAVVAAYAAMLCWIGFMGLLAAGNGLSGAGPLVFIPIVATLSAVAIARLAGRVRPRRALP